MIWVGIGLTIIGLALLALVGVLIKPLIKVSAVLDDVKKTTKDLPQTVNDATAQVNEALHTGVDTLQQINIQLKELTPIFYLVGDVGRATHQLSSNMVNAVEDFEEKETASFASRKNLEGLYGALTLGAMIFKKAKTFNNERKIVNEQ
ncbi:DUF948 domain-containing protein [Ralstonia pickettii]|nr:DUF948 domain-containing protein [Ralstonia pickettii]